MVSSFTLTVGTGRYGLTGVAVRTDGGLQVYIGGGERSHIGAVAVSQPRPSLVGDGSLSCTTSVFNLLGHKDDAIAVPVAEELCRRLNQVVVVTAGVHVEQASPEEAEELAVYGREVGRRVLQRLAADEISHGLGLP